MNKNNFTQTLSVKKLAELSEDFVPSEEQSRVVSAPLEPILVSAGAGSGKTFTLAARVLYLIVNHGLGPEQILGLTFTRKAAAELNRKLNKKVLSLRSYMIDNKLSGIARIALKDLDLPLQVSTYDAFVGSVLKEFGALGGMDTNYALISEAQKIELVQQVLSNWSNGSVIPADRSFAKGIGCIIDLSDQLRSHGADTNSAKEAYQSYIQAVDALSLELEKAYGDALINETTLNSRLKDLEKVKTNLKQNMELLPVVQAYWDLKETYGVKDFSDQTAQALILSERVPMVGDILRERYRAVLLDEFQDTSVVQMDFLSRLFKDHPVSAVGDPKQAIYGWRGASANSMADFGKYFSSDPLPETRIYSLTQTRRNEAAILRCANQLSKTLNYTNSFFPPDYKKQPIILDTGFRLKKADSDQINQQNPGLLSAQAPAIKIPNDELRPLEDKQGGFVQVAYTLDDMGEAQVIAQYLLEHFCGAGAQLEQGEISQPQAAILVRKRNILSPILSALNQHGVPYQLLGDDMIFSDRGVKLVLNLLRITNDPGRGTDLAALLDMCNLRRTDIQILSNLAVLGGREKNIYDVLLQAPSWDSHQLKPKELQQVSMLPVPVRQSLQWLGGALNNLADSLHLPLLDLCERARVLLGLDTESLAGNPEVSQAAWQGFTSLVHDFVSQSFNNPSLNSFLTYLDIALEEEQGLGSIQVKTDKTKVQIMTVHSAKGLEWDIVCLPGLDRKTFPETQITAPKSIKEDQFAAFGLGLADLEKTAGGMANSNAFMEYACDYNNHEPLNSMWFQSFPTMARSLQKDGDHLVDYNFSTIEITQKNQVSLWKKHAAKAARREVFFEEMRLAYVAFTRAKSRLLLTGKWIKKDSKEKNVRHPSAIISLLSGRGLASVFPANDYLREHNIDTWVREVDQDLKQETKLKAALWPAGLRLDRAENRTLRKLSEELRKQIQSKDAHQTESDFSLQELLTQASVLMEREKTDKEDRGVLFVPGSVTEMSSFVTNAQSFQLDKARPLPTEPTSYTRLGNLFHRWVELSIDNAYPLPIEGLDDPVGSQQLAEQLQRCKDNFMSMPFRNMRAICTEEDARLSVDIGSQHQVVFNMRIDAVLQDEKDGTVWIVDWKTGRRPKKSQYALWVHQLGLYRLYWLAKNPNLDPRMLRCAYVFVSTTDPRDQILDLTKICKELGIEQYSDQYLRQVWDKAASSLNV